MNDWVERELDTEEGGVAGRSMISLLRGKIAEKSLGKIVIDIQGVGYGVTVPLSTYYRLPERGNETELKIYTHMKEDGIELFGFLTADERKRYRERLKRIPKDYEKGVRKSATEGKENTEKRKKTKNLNLFSVSPVAKK